MCSADSACTERPWHTMLCVTYEIPAQADPAQPAGLHTYGSRLVRTKAPSALPIMHIIVRHWQSVAEYYVACGTMFLPRAVAVAKV